MLGWVGLGQPFKHYSPRFDPLTTWTKKARELKPNIAQFEHGLGCPKP